MTRRTAIALMAGAAPATSALQGAAPGEAISLGWLAGAAPSLTCGISWGVPWPRGTVSKEQSFTLTSGEKRLPLQSWTLAYWPDGSVKWTGVRMR